MPTFCYKEIQINNYDSIITDLIRTIDYHSFQNNFNYIDTDSILKTNLNLNKWVIDNNCKVIKSAVIVSTVRSSYADPHIDSQENSLALNFPLSNCNDSYTVFYDPDNIDSIIDEKKPNGVIYKKIKFNTQPREIDRYILDRPIILNTKIPHKIFHNSQAPRYAISFRFERDPWHLI
jgi:hypothetical protein